MLFVQVFSDRLDHSPHPNPGYAPRVLMPVEVLHLLVSMNLRALIHSGADENMMDWGLAAELRLRPDRLARPKLASKL